MRLIKCHKFNELNTALPNIWAEQSACTSPDENFVTRSVQLGSKNKNPNLRTELVGVFKLNQVDLWHLMRRMFFAWPNSYDVLLNCIKLFSMGAWSEGLPCADPGARAPIGASRNLDQKSDRRESDDVDQKQAKSWQCILCSFPFHNKSETTEMA